MKYIVLALSAINILCGLYFLLDLLHIFWPPRNATGFNQAMVALLFIQGFGGYYLSHYHEKHFLGLLVNILPALIISTWLYFSLKNMRMW